MESSAIFISIFIICLLTGIENGQETIVDSVKLSPTHPIQSDKFGSAVDIFQHHIIVGSHGNSRVYIYEYDGKHWNTTAIFSKSQHSHCGRVVSIAEQFAAFSCDSCSNQSSGLGCVNIVRLNGTSWIDHRTIVSPIAGDDQHFGASLHVSNRSLFIGMNSETSVGRLYLYYLHNGDWIMQNILSLPVNKGSDLVGNRISVSGPYIAVGVPHFDLGADTDAGRVFVFKRSIDSSWVSIATLDAPTPVIFGKFGVSIYIDIDMLLVGYQSDPSNRIPGGSVHVYRRQGQSYKHETKLVPSDTDYKDAFACSISSSNGDIVVGANHDSSAAYLYRYINGTWREVYQFLALENDVRTFGKERLFGCSVATMDDLVVLGSAVNEGSVNVFDFGEIQRNLDDSTSPVGSLGESRHSGRSATKYLYNSSIFKIECHEEYVIGFWQKDTATDYDNISLSLDDPSCTNYTSNETTISIRTSFDKCGSKVEVHDNVIIQKNVVNIKMTTYIGNIVKRVYHRKYNMECIFPRQKNVSLDVGYKVSDQVSAEQLFDLSTVSDVDVSLHLYSSSAYQIRSEYPIEVTMNEPMYIGIRKMSVGMSLKFVVEKCFATPTAAIHGGDSYIFFHKKCPLDPTFKIIESNAEYFNFAIDTFQFIRLSKAVFVHCRLLICIKNSTSPDCQQVCHHRKRKSLLEDTFPEPSTQKITYISSGRINFVKKRDCSDHTCQSNAQCFDAFPAVCRCDQGYVLSYITNKCSKDRILHLQDLRMHTKWLDSYTNPSSIEYVRFAERTERVLMELFVALKMAVEGVKLINVREGSVVMEIALLYPKQYRREDIYHEFLQQIRNVNQTSALFQEANIAQEDVVLLKPDNEMEIDDADDESADDSTISTKPNLTKTLLIILIPSVVFVMTLVVICRLVFRKIMSAKRSKKFETGDLYFIESPRLRRKRYKRNEFDFVGNVQLERKSSIDSGLEIVGLENVRYEF